MPAQDLHSCSYMCARMECVKAQRDELRERLRRYADKLEDALVAGEHAVGSVADCTSPVMRDAADTIAELERDAARYRWIRGPDRIEVAYLINKSDVDLDAAIDAAMKD